MAEVQISQEEVKGIDINQVTSMQLKDGTVVVINPVEEQYDDQAGEEYVQEELPQEQKEVDECCQQGDQSNKLRARPMQYGVVPPRVKVVPAPIVQVPKVGVIPPNIRPPPKSMVARPPVVVPGYAAKPLLRPAVVPTPVAPLPVKPVPATVVRPVPSTLNKPLVSQMIQAPRFRARPGTQEEEEFQEEEYAGDEYCECNEECQAKDANQLRARPMAVPMKVVPVPTVPKVFPVPRVVPKLVPFPKVVPVPVKRGPTHLMPGYNTFQPRVFRARPRVMAQPVPMFTPLTGTFQPSLVTRPKLPMHHHPHRPPRVVMAPVGVPRFRAKRSNTCEPQRNNCEETCENECNKTCVCTKCGKEF
jgi:hypothetical protein